MGEPRIYDQTGDYHMAMWRALSKLMAPLKIAFVAWNAETTCILLESLAIDNADQVKRYDRSRGRITLKDGTEIYGVHDHRRLEGLYFDQIIVADDYRRRTFYVCNDLLKDLEYQCQHSCVPEEYRYQLYDIGQEAPRDGYI